MKGARGARDGPAVDFAVESAVGKAELAGDHPHGDGDGDISSSLTDMVSPSLKLRHEILQLAAGRSLSEKA